MNELLDKLQRDVQDVFFIQIGAMDGVTFDPLRRHIVTNKWRGILVEPLVDCFTRLCANYSGMQNLTFENVAITEKQEVRRLNRVPSNAISGKGLPEWTLGIASFFTDRNAIGGIGCSQEEYERIRDCVIEEEVKCIPLDTLLSLNDVDRIDLLQIDTEGYDFRILKQLDFTRYRPYVINIEFVLLPPDEQRECLRLLAQNGYKVGKSSEYDLVATIWERAGNCCFRRPGDVRINA
jgi:FkbM family methyltransferase